MLRDAGFDDINIVVKEESAKYISQWLPGSGAEEYVASANITACKSGVAKVAASTARSTAARKGVKKGD